MTCPLGGGRGPHGSEKQRRRRAQLAKRAARVASALGEPVGMCVFLNPPCGIGLLKVFHGLPEGPSEAEKSENELYVTIVLFTFCYLFGCLKFFMGRLHKVRFWLT